MSWPRYFGKARLKKHSCDCCGRDWTNPGEIGVVLQYKGGDLTIRFEGFTYAWPITSDKLEFVESVTVPLERTDPNEGLEL